MILSRVAFYLINFESVHNWNRFWIFQPSKFFFLILRHFSWFDMTLYVHFYNDQFDQEV